MVKPPWEVKMLVRRSALAILLLASPSLLRAALTTTDMTILTPTDLVETLLGSGVKGVQNISLVSGGPTAAGTFAGGTGIIGFEGGILLSTGDIASVVGPNLFDGMSMPHGSPGDADLDLIVAPFTTNDTTVLEFDFIPCGDKVTFEYVFASEEYNEFVFSFNDVFAFYLNGKNVALLPDGITPVSIDNVNGGNPFGIGAVNPAYYINNDIDDGGGLIDTEMDGLTVVLKVEAPVNKLVLNHIKLAIADVGDDWLDSNVFIRAGTFSSLGPFIRLDVSGPVGAGVADMVTFTLTAKNAGTGLATSMLLVNPLPAGVDFISADSGRTFDGTNVEWSLGSLSPGMSVTVSMTALVNGSTSTIPNSAVLDYEDSGGIPQPSVSPCPWDVIVWPRIPVLRKDVLPAGGISNGMHLDYVISYSNAGNATIYDLTITDTLPNGVTYAGSSLQFFAESDFLGAPALTGVAYAPGTVGPWVAGEPGAGAAAPLVLRWVVDRVMPGRSGAITFGVDVSASLIVGSVVRNSASATVYTDPAVYPAPAVTSTVTTYVPMPLLSVFKNAPMNAPMEQAVPFVIAVENIGLDAAYNLVIVDTLPAPLTVASASGGGTVVGNVAAWNLPQLLPGEVFTVTVTAWGPDAISEYSVTNEVRLDYFNLPVSGIARPPAFDSAEVTFVPPKPLLSLIKQGPATVETRTPFTYTIVVVNVGLDPAFDILIVDTLPSPLRFVSAEGMPDVVGNVISWRVARLSPGESFSAKVSAQGPSDDGDYVVTNVAEATCWTRAVGGFPGPSARGQATVVLEPFLIVKVFPRPYDRGKAVRGTLKFSGIPNGAAVWIYTVGGMEVRHLTGPVRHRLEWDGRNTRGSKVAPGVYLYVIGYRDDAGEKKYIRGKFGLIR